MNHTEQDLIDMKLELQMVKQKILLLPRTHAMRLQLLHGRNDPVADMDDTGYHGPALHGLKFFHVTYCTRISIEDQFGPLFHALTFEDDKLKLVVLEADVAELGIEPEQGAKQTIMGLECRVMWFGDWEITVENPNAP